MTLPTLLTQGATTHLKDGLPVTTVSNLGMLTPASEAVIMQIKDTADKALAAAGGGGGSGGGGASSEELEEVKQTANEANTRSLSNKASIDSLTESLDDTNSTLTSYTSATDTRIAAVESKTTAIESKTTALESKIDTVKADLISDISDANDKIDAVDADLKQDIADVDSKIDSVKSELEQDISDLETSLNAATDSIAALETKHDNSINDINALLDTTVVSELDLQQQLTGEYVLSSSSTNLKTKDTTTSTWELDLASSDKAGLMPKESYQAIDDLQSRVASLESGGIWRETFATYQDLIARYPDLDVSSTDWTVNDYVEVESDSNYDDDPTRYVVVVNGQVKTLVFQKRMQAAVQIATTSATGVVLGSADTYENKYKVFVENDGSMTLIGANDIEANLSVAVPYSSVVGESVGQYKIVEKDGLLFRANSAILEVPAVFDPTAWTQVGGRDMELDEVTISKNEDDELQAIGVIEKNKGNTKYDWVGTYQEWLDQNVAEEHPEWICYVTDDATELLFANDIFDFKRTDRLLDSLYWVRADDFAWHDGQKYSAMYQHLLNDWNNGTLQTETVNGHTFQYMLAPDKHKLFSSDGDGEDIAQALFEETGIAWYYIIDLDSPRFKLPRNSFDFVGYRTGAGNYVPESVPNITGSTSHLASDYGSDTWSARGAFYKVNSYAGKGNTGTSGKYAYSLGLDASLSSSAYQDGAPVQQRAVETYLYFFTGNYTKDAITQAAYVNGEMFDGKANTNLNNLEDAGKNIANWSNNVTNCVTNISKDFTLIFEQNATDVTCYVEKGGKLWYPDGFESDGTTKKFSYLTLTENLPINVVLSVTGTDTVFTAAAITSSPYNLDGYSTRYASALPASGDGWSIYYSEAENKAYRWNPNDSVWRRCTFPFCKLRRSNEPLKTKALEVFDGYSRCGVKYWLFPGFTAVHSDNYNKDGTPASKKVVVKKVLQSDGGVTSGKLSQLILNIAGDSCQLAGLCKTWSYNEQMNSFTYLANGDRAWIDIGTYTADSNEIIDFNIKRPLQPVDFTGADVVIKYQRQTAANGYTWYRLYKSGWVEQGGYVEEASTIAANSGRNIVVDLPIEMLDTNYSCIASSTNSTGSQYASVNLTPVKTSVTQITIKFYNTATAATAATVMKSCWEVKGSAKR